MLSQRGYGCHAGARTMGGVRFDRKADFGVATYDPFGKIWSTLRPARSIQNQDAVRLVRFQSVAKPSAALSVSRAVSRAIG